MSYNYVISRECEEWAVDPVDLALAAKEEREPKGRLWKFARWSRKVWEDLGQEGRRLMPDPIAAVLEVIEEITAKDADILRRLHAEDMAETAKAKAERRRPVLVSQQFVSLTAAWTSQAYATKVRYLAPGSPELMGFLTSAVGEAHLFYLLLRVNHKDIDVETAFDVYWDLASNDGADGRKTPGQIIGICNGRSPEPAKKKPAPDSSTPTTPTTDPSIGPTSTSI